MPELYALFRSFLGGNKLIFAQTALSLSAIIVLLPTDPIASHVE